MRGMRGPTAWAMLAFASATPALAQTGWVAVTHDDPDGLVQFGETVHLTVTLGWAGAAFFGRVEGSVPAPGGTSSNLSTEFPAIPPITSVGVPNGGGVSGFYAEIPTAPAYTPLVLPVYNQFSGIRALEFD
ncbi:MAG: hypothetical protein H6809_03630 [Phycisphaeraceae bacterium]|nr:hypothetical protein [Phycisphaeraceae bacterium]